MLQGMEIAPSAPIATLASTNQPEAIDSAVRRTGRFDSVIIVPWPDREARARILHTLLDGMAGGGDVDVDRVAASLGERTSGSDIRELVTRALLASADARVTTEALVAEIGAGRFRAEVPAGGVYL